MAKRTRIVPRKIPRQSRSAATVTALLDATARVLAEVGYESSSVNHVARVAGVSVGSLYQYFPSKEALVMATLKRHNERMIAVFQDNIAELVLKPLPQAVRGIVERTTRAYGLDAPLLRVILREEPKFGVMARSRDFEEQLHLLLKGYFTFHAKALRPRDHELSTRLLRVAVESVVADTLMREPERLYDDAFIGELSELVLGYIVPRR